VEGQQSRLAGEGAFREEPQGVPTAGGGDQAAGILDASFLGKAFHESTAQTTQKPASDELPLQFPFGDEGKLPGHGGQDGSPVEIAGVIADEDAGLLGGREMFQTLDLERNAAQPGQQAAGPLAQVPAPRFPGQEQDRQPGQGASSTNKKSTTNGLSV